jgi:hypothetical protein
MKGEASERTPSLSVLQLDLKPPLVLTGPRILTLSVGEIIQ